MRNAVITIRAAKVSDAPRIARMEKSYIDCPWNETQVAAEIVRNNVLFLVATADDNVVGYLSGECAADECEVSNIAVDLAYRRQKIGTKLFTAFIDKAGERGVKRLYLLVNRTNNVAISLYESIGFCSVGLRRGYYGDGDAVVMRLEL